MLLITRLRTRLLLLVVIAAIPMLALTLIMGLQLRQQAIIQAADSALRTARLAAFNQERTIESTRQLLITLAELPVVREDDTAACNTFFADLLQQFPLYANLGVIALDGSVVCSGLPVDSAMNLGDRAYFQRALQDRGFAIGDYQIGRITGKPSVNFGYPVLDNNGEVQAVVFAALDLALLNGLARDARLPEGAALTVVDTNGTVLVRFPDSEAWVGQTLPDVPLIQTILTQGEGNARRVGLNGKPMLAGFTALANVPADGAVYVVVGIPEDVAFAEANRVFVQSLIGLSLVVVVLLLIVWAGSHQFIMRPLRVVLHAIQQLSAGDLSTRTGWRSGPQEFQQLAHAFDAMALSLETQEMGLRESEERFRLLAENVGDMVCLHAPDGTYLYLTPSCETVLGYTPDKLVGTDPRDLLHPDDREIYWQGLNGQSGDSLTYRVRKQSGAYIWLEMTMQPVANAQGQIVRLVSASRDVTERKQIMETLHRYNARFQTLHAIDRGILTAQSAEAVAELALQAVLQQVSAAGVSIVLFDFQTGEGVVFAALDQEGEQQQMGTRFSLAVYSNAELDAFRQGRVQVVEDSTALPHVPPGLQALGSSERQVYVRIPLIAQDELLGAFNLSTDSTEGFTPERIQIAQEVADQLAIAIQQARLREAIARHAEVLEQQVAERTADLRRIRDRMAIILNNSSDAIALVDVDGVIEQTNRAFNTLFGYRHDEAFGRSLTELVTAGDAAGIGEALWAAVSSGQPQRIEAVADRGHDVSYAVDLALAPVPVAKGEPAYVICSLRDITRRKQAEAALRQALQQEKELSELKSRFVSMIVHDFRNPLAAMTMSVGLLQRHSDRLTDERKQEHLNRIQIDIKRLTDLLNDTLIVSQAESVGLEFDPIPLDLKVYCHELIEETRLLAGETHQLVFAASGDCTQARMDPKLLRHMLTNLLSNALKYSPADGAVQFDLHCEHGQAMIHVKDKGIGIPQEDQKRLFEVFHRARNVGQTPGTGLGLVIVKQAVEAHGGTISVESAVNLGTTFTVVLPMTPVG